MDAWLPFIIMTAFSILTAFLAFLAGKLKKED
jgi:predicted anti-sigma-YlaC factor YlaD